LSCSVVMEGEAETETARARPTATMDHAIMMKREATQEMSPRRNAESTSRSTLDQRASGL
jgi:hypothetical protein